MHKHPDADAFMRGYLAQPTDATTRLVFADWLEETGEPHNAAWAYYIRLRDEADRYPSDSREHRELFRQADAYAPKIRAKLTMSAKRFVGYPKSLLQLLPAANISVRLAGFELPRAALEYMPESVARENVLFPLDLQGGTLWRAMLIAAADPYNRDTAQKLEFILNCDIVLVGAERNEIAETLDRSYGPWDVEYFDSGLVEFVDTAVVFDDTASRDWSEWAAPDFIVVRLVNLIFVEAVNLRADRILMYPDLGSLLVRYRIDGEWVERDRQPLRFLRGAFGRIATMAGISSDRVFGEPGEPLTGEFALRVHHLRVRMRATILPSPDEPTTQIDISS